MEKTFHCSMTDPIVQTTQGALRGYQFDGTYVFKGVPYAKAERYMMPHPVEPWQGVRDALVWGLTAPVPTDYMYGDDFTVAHRFWPQGEDCQVLNIWTGSLDKTAKKPVMVWFHGGGFYNGSSMELIAYEGENLSKHSDVVVVTVNHRLNMLGFLDLSSFGERYWNSGNLGLADLVASLEWIRDNIAQFGGDPDNVTIFGQSGGGGKVTAMMQTPSASGLFHKAVIMSGTMGPSGEDEAARWDDGMLARRMLELMGRPTDDAAYFETAPLRQLQDAYLKACGEFYGADLMMPEPHGPVINGWYLGKPMEVGFSEHAKKVPIMIGSVIAEMGYHKPLKPRDEISEEETRELVAQEYGEENADEIIRLFKAAYPDKAPVYAIYLSHRVKEFEYAAEKARVSEAPVFNYNFCLVFPHHGGVPAWHCAEIPFVFHNAEMFPLYHIPGVTEQLQEVVSGAWTNFARTGDPSGGVVGEWPAMTADQDVTYVFDKVSGAKTSYDRELMELVQRTQKPRFFF